MRRPVPVLLAAGGAVVLAAGVALIIAARDAGFGWTAYSPLSDTAYVAVQPVPAGPILLAVLGAAALGAGAALLVDRARRARSDEGGKHR